MSKSESKNPVLRVVAVITALVGLAVSGFALWDRLLKPKPADLHVEFALTRSDEFPIAPAEADSGWLAPFPLGLVVRNSGEMTAEDVSLSVTYPVNLILSPVDSTARLQSVVVPTGQRMMMTLQGRDLHPKQVWHLDFEINARAENTLKIPVEGYLGDSTRVNAEFEMVLSYLLDTELVAKDRPVKRSRLRLTIGPEHMLKQRFKRFFVVSALDSAGRYELTGYSLVDTGSVR
ncbi:MAG TPA: hypothetical protein VF746_17030 [Longimicrobium sp.]|jgi:hypothetical protein